MENTYRVVGWCVHEDGSKSVGDIFEFPATKTQSGTHRKLGRIILTLLNSRAVDYIKIEEVGPLGVLPRSYFLSRKERAG